MQPQLTNKTSNEPHLDDRARHRGAVPRAGHLRLDQAVQQRVLPQAGGVHDGQHLRMWGGSFGFVRCWLVLVLVGVLRFASRVMAWAAPAHRTVTVGVLLAVVVFAVAAVDFVVCGQQWK